MFRVLRALLGGDRLSALRVRAIGHEDRLTVVGHLDELRSRILTALVVLAATFGLCFWQNQTLLRVIDAPLARQTEKQVLAGRGPLGDTYKVSQRARDVALRVRTVVLALNRQGQPAAVRSALNAAAAGLRHDAAALAARPHGDRPVTLGIGEPFATTVTVSFIFALILSLPVLLGQAWGFLLPALEPEQRRRLRPLLAGVPVLFVTGVLFGYFVVMPAAVHFLQNFNSGEFNVLVQASQYYKFAATMLLAIGLVFELPVAILAVTRAGLVSPHQLRRHRRYAVAACCAIAALLPGDVVTMLLETVPLYVLFELSVLIASMIDRRAHRGRSARGVAAAGAE